MLGAAFTAALGFRFDIWRNIWILHLSLRCIKKIKNNIESTWPKYKIKAANEMIISKHGIKLKSRRDEDDQKTLH